MTAPVRLARWSWWAVTVAFGAVAVVGLTLLLTPVALLALCVLAGLLGWISHHATGEQAARRCRLPVGLAGHVAMSYGVVLAVAGLTALFGPSGGLLVGLHATAWPVVARTAARRAARRVSDSPAARASVPGARGLSDEQLCWAWSASCTAITRAPGAAERSRLAALRAGYLDELERRAPAGFAPWLAGGARADEDPHRLLR